MTVKNNELLNTIRKESSLEYQDKVPVATSVTGVEVLQVLNSYPTLQNEFINTLTNKVVKTKFFNKVFNNPLRMLHKGELPFGKSIEELFVEMAEVKGWNENFENSSSDEGNLIKVTKPNVKPSYISQNYQYKYKTSISEHQLRGAFMNSNGLTGLVKAIIDSLYTSVYYKEFTDMKKILVNPSADSDGGSTIGEGLANRIFKDNTLKESAICYCGNTNTYRNLLKGIKRFSGKMTFPSDKYNLNKVQTFTDKKDLVIFTTCDTKAELDVDVLAGVFNLSKTETNLRVIEVDTLGTVNNKEVLAILADKDIIQAYDTINEANSFHNPERLTTNLFMHRHGIMAQCDFAQAVVFLKGDKE